MIISKSKVKVSLPQNEVSMSRVNSTYMRPVNCLELANFVVILLQIVQLAD